MARRYDVISAEGPEILCNCVVLILILYFSKSLALFRWLVMFGLSIAPLPQFACGSNLTNLEFMGDTHSAQSLHWDFHFQGAERWTAHG